MSVHRMFTLIGIVFAITSQAVVPATEPDGTASDRAWVTPAITAPGV